MTNSCRVLSAPLFLRGELSHIPEGFYTDNSMPPTTEQAVIMLSSHLYESRDGSTGGFMLTACRPASRCGIR